MLALGEGRFRPAMVTSGMESGDYIEILSGLREGELIVTSGQFLLDSEASLKASFIRMEDEQEPDPDANPPMDGMDMPKRDDQ